MTQPKTALRSFILTFIDDDRPGLVQEIADIVTQHSGNWLTSRMTQLDGKFAGLARIDAPDANAESLCSALQGFAADRFILSIEQIDAQQTPITERYELDIVGNDRPGIIHEVTRALANQQLNVVDLSSDLTRAAMSGMPLFSCIAAIEVAQQLDLDTLQTQLTTIATDLDLDIQFAPATSKPVRGK